MDNVGLSCASDQKVTDDGNPLQMAFRLTR
jgi:hypothetical protein